MWVVSHHSIALWNYATLSQVLGQHCQPDGQPHDSAEDAAWALELVRHVVDTSDAAAAAASGGLKSAKAVRDVVAPALAIGVPLHFGLRLKLHQLPPEVCTMCMSA